VDVAVRDEAVSKKHLSLSIVGVMGLTLENLGTCEIHPVVGGVMP
jgi:hypothetical protein